jgi:hypothetical protein
MTQVIYNYELPKDGSVYKYTSRRMITEWLENQARKRSHRAGRIHRP